MSEKSDIKQLIPVIVMLGFTALVAQAVLMRELVIVFTGNELTLGIILSIWLLWTAFGSGVVGRLVQKCRQPKRLLIVSQFLLALLLPLSVVFVRLSRNVLPMATGEISNPLFIILIPLLALAPACVLIGFLYPLACKLLSAHKSDSRNIPGRVFLWESVGSGLAGFIASIFLFRFLSNFQIIEILCVFNFFIAMLLIVAPRKTGKYYLAPIALTIALIFLYFAPTIDSKLSKKQWGTLNLIESQTTIYGNIAVTKLGDDVSFYENGMLMFSVPDEMSAEESVHYAMLEHPSPKSVLLIGGSVAGSLEQILFHPSVKKVDYVLLDPAILELAKKNLPSLEKNLGDERIRIVFDDGRKFIEHTNATYDVIIIDLPDPQTTLINRFYTLEFFRAVKNRMANSGILAFSISSSENVLSQTQRTVLNCLYYTVQQVFPEILLIPGNSVQFIVCNSPHILQKDANVLVQRLAERQLPTSYVREYFIPYRMAPDRMDYISDQIDTENIPPANRDFRPIGYFNSILLWLTFFRSNSEQLLQSISQIHPGIFISIFSAAFLIFIFASRVIYRTSDRIRLAIFFAIMITGFTAISIEVQIILGFQAVYGYAFYQLALIMSGFMIGLTLGSWSALRVIRAGQASLKMFIYFQATLALYPLITYGVLMKLSQTRVPGFFIQIILLILIAGIGFIGGFQFPLANHLTHREDVRIERTGGSLYAMDLTGSVFGALLTSAFLVPLFGLGWTSLFFCGLNALTVLMIVSFKN